MRVLIVTHVIYPFQSPRSSRSTELAKELARVGHEVTIYANVGDFDYSLFESQYKLKIKKFAKLYFIKKKTSGKEKHSLLSKILIKFFRRLLFYPNIEFLFNIKRSLKNENNYDLLISIAAPHSIHWGCERAFKKKPTLAKKWIADCGNPFMGNELENPPFYFENLERKFCRKADFIVVPVEQAKQAYYSDYLEKIVVIPQGFDFRNIMLYQGVISNNVPTFCFSGMVYKALRDPSKFLKFLSTLGMDFKFIIYTKDTSIFPPFISKLNGKLEIKEYIPREELLYELSKMDFLVNFENNSITQSPSKLIDYALVNRPILNVNCEKMNESTILEFLNGNYVNKVEVDKELYNIETVAKQFIKLAK